MKPLKCHHCEYEWAYKGNALYEACCPRCRYRTKINWNAEELEAITLYHKQKKEMTEAMGE